MTLLRQPASKFGSEVLSFANAVKSAEMRRLGVQTAWTCRRCRDSRLTGPRAMDDAVQRQWTSRRQFSSTIGRRDKRPVEPRNPNDRISSTLPTSSEPYTPASSSSSLPSHTANRRSDISKQASRILDTLLARASVASQHINAYTGTDYSGIEAVRKEIIDLEKNVRSLHATVDRAKAKHHDAYAKQTSAQREIVGLLERKSSWSPTDLERYMSLVRSEHLNDQDVQGAKDNLAVAERDLEEARSLLEKLERKQYHEEQIWSDTIRRNSTWVTFGLMGVNILLLLAQIAIFEPYRRRKIVREVKSALDEKTLSAVPTSASAVLEKQIDALIPPENVTLEQIAESQQPLDALLPIEQSTQTISPWPDEAQPADGADPAASGSIDQVESQKIANRLPAPTSRKSAESSYWSAYQELVLDLFSERPVQVRMVDMTSMAIHGAATGAAIVGLVVLLLRPR